MGGQKIMATETTNLKLTKPALDDYVLVSDINENSDKIDNAHGEGSSAITTLATSVNDTNTALDNHKADYVAHPGYADATGTNAYSVSLKPAAKSLVKGLGVVFTVANDATGNCTLNVNGLGAKAIMSSDGEQITDLKKGVVYTVRYNGASFTLQGKGGGLDTLKIMQWLATTEPFKSSGYYMYLSKEKRILVRGGSGFPNAMRIYDLKGALIKQILLITDTRISVSNENIFMYRASPGLLVVYDFNGDEVYRTAPGGTYDPYLVAASVSHNVIVTTDGRISFVGYKTYVRLNVRKLDLNFISYYNMEFMDGAGSETRMYSSDTFLSYDNIVMGSLNVVNRYSYPDQNAPPHTCLFQESFTSPGTWKGELNRIQLPTIL